MRIPFFSYPHLHLKGPLLWRKVEDQPAPSIKGQSDALVKQQRSAAASSPWQSSEGSQRGLWNIVTLFPILSTNPQLRARLW